MRPRLLTDHDGVVRRACRTVVLGLALAVLGVGGALAAVGGLSEPSQASNPALQGQSPALASAVIDTFPPLPTIKTPVDEPAAILESYTFVAEHPEVANYMPCFCACGRDKTHKSIEDCFIKSRGAKSADLVWSAHGGECMICMAVAAEARRLFLEGRSVTAIREEIERTLAPKYRFHTDTPMPPKASHHH